MKASPEIPVHETAFIQAFIQKDSRERLLFECQRHRGRFLSRFAHDALRYLDARYVHPIPSPNSDPAQILRLLQARKAPAFCHALSSRRELDGQLVSLAEALRLSVGFGMPTILSCLPGSLCYLETEQVAGPPERFILARPPAPSVAST